MDNIEEKVEKLLNGAGLEVPDFEHARAVTLKKSACYIVSAVIFNAEGEVLMVQEAKRECYGRWYLPAGRMEAGERIHQALRREVKEEAGLECEPVTMLLVQEQGRQWIRFAFLAEVTGGSLKTPSEADSESLQAQWWDRATPLPLRSRDILCLIEAGVRYRQTSWFPVSHPVSLPCSVVCQRLLLVFTREERSWLLLAKRASDSDSRACLPVTVCEKGQSIERAGNRLVQGCVRAAADPALKVTAHGILSLQHDAGILGQSDGICFNTIVSLEASEASSGPPLLDGEEYVWSEVTDQSLKEKILKRIKERSFLPIVNNP